MKGYIIFLVIIFILGGLSYKIYIDHYSKNASFKKGKVKFIEQNIEIKAKIAESAAEREQGLMFVKKMSDDEGMIFIFPHEQRQGFWMRNTYITLDIIYIGEDFKVRNIHYNATPMSEEILSSILPVKYVVEVNAGFAKKHGIKFGDSIEFKN